MFAKDFPITTVLLVAAATFVVVLIVKGLARVIKEIYSCWMGRKIRAVNNNARNTAESGNVFSMSPFHTKYLFFQETVVHNFFSLALVHLLTHHRNWSV
jgi:hypothetical protein